MKGENAMEDKQMTKKRKNELAIVMPKLTAYQFMAYGLAILLTEDRLKNWYYNRFIQVMCVPEFLFGRSTPDFYIYGAHLMR